MPNSVKSLNEAFAAWALQRSFDEFQQFRVRLDGFELRKFLLHLFRRVDEEADVRLAEHRGVVVGIAGGDDVIVQRLQRGDGFLFLVRLAQLVTGDAVVLDDEPVAE